MKGVYKNQEAGYTLIGVLVIFTILVILGMSLIMLSLTSVKTSTKERDDQAVFYVAEAGVNYKVNDINRKVNNIYDEVLDMEEEEYRSKEDIFYDKLGTRLPGDDKYEKFEMEDTFSDISVQLVDGKRNEFLIRSRGYINNQIRTLEQTITIGWQEKFNSLPDMAVFVKEYINLNNNAGITGNIGSMKKGTSSIIAKNNAYIDGEVRVPKGYEKVAINASNNADIPEAVGIDMGTFPGLPRFPSIPQSSPVRPNIKLNNNENMEYDLISSQKINNIYLSNNSTLLFDVGDTNKELIVGRLTIGNTGHIRIKGTGKLTIYLTDNLSMANNSTLNNNGDVNILNLFFSGGNQIELDNNVLIKGSLFSKSANITISNNSSIYGNIFSGGNHIQFENNTSITSQLIMAPNAQVTISNNGRVNGVVISNNLNLGNNSHVKYGTPFILTGPISPNALEHDDKEEDGDVQNDGKPRPSLGPLREVTN